MNPRCRLLADDLTGALDSAAMLAGAGAVPVALDGPASLEPAAPVQACATASRDLPPSALAQQLAPCLDWLAGGGLAFKKIDSLLRGNTFAELAWLAHSGRFRRLVVAPAFPAQGRIVAGGVLRLAGAAAQAQVALAERLHAVGALATGDGAFALGPARVEIPDAASDADLDALMQGADGAATLWCGSAGLAAALARVQGLVAPPPQQLAPAAGTVWLVTGTRHPVLRGQLARMAARGWPAHCRFVDLAPAGELSPAAATEALAQGAERLLASGPPPSQLVVIGGDSLLALCRAAGVRTLRAGPSPRPGWGCARLAGGRWDGVACLSRSGAFGGPADLLDLLRALAPRLPQPSSESLPA